MTASTGFFANSLKNIITVRFSEFEDPPSLGEHNYGELECMEPTEHACS